MVLYGKIDEDVHLTLPSIQIGIALVKCMRIETLEKMKMLHST